MTPVNPGAPLVLLLTLAASLAVAACDIVEPDYDLFDEQRQYLYPGPDCNPMGAEGPCYALVALCPDGSATYNRMGADVIEPPATYRIFGSRVRVTVPATSERLYFTLSSDGQTLIEDGSGHEWVRGTVADLCPA